VPRKREGPRVTPPEITDEMCNPGGTWDEWQHVPALADLECPRCGQIGVCDEDCA
jgi:hypothetical protein